MKTYVLLIFVLILTACSSTSVSEDAVNHFKKEYPLTLEMVVPDSISVNRSSTLEIILKQNNNLVDGLDNVRFTIWKKDDPASADEKLAESLGDGRYRAKKRFEENGIYYVKIYASSNGSTIMPTKQLVVGELSEQELEGFQQDPSHEEHEHTEHH